MYPLLWNLGDHPLLLNWGCWWKRTARAFLICHCWSGGSGAFHNCHCWTGDLSLSSKVWLWSLAVEFGMLSDAGEIGVGASSHCWLRRAVYWSIKRQTKIYCNSYYSRISLFGRRQEYYCFVHNGTRSDMLSKTCGAKNVNSLFKLFPNERLLLLW